MQKSASSPSDSLGEEFSAGKALLQLLKTEQELLIQADVDGLARLTEDKAKTVARMSELALRRHRSLAAAGFEASEAGMQNWVKGKSLAEKSWNELLEVGRQAKEQNRVNGMLITQHMARTQNALKILQGTPQGGNLYGPDGQSTSQSSRRTLVVG